MARGTRFMQELFDEKIKFGGLVVTRGQAVVLMQRGQVDKRAIDYFAFHPEALPEGTPSQFEIADRLFYRD